MADANATMGPVAGAAPEPVRIGETGLLQQLLQKTRSRDIPRLEKPSWTPVLLTNTQG
jgi:hypothetical protein